ncbi:MAG TPA: transglycosylase SLT domain-containing protein [Thermoanaerobaculia bacterium]|nr:transglycosylase SLT domain-containing protein [Thermoanaerobaculia bacterium]
MRNGLVLLSAALLLAGGCSSVSPRPSTPPQPAGPRIAGTSERDVAALRAALEEAREMLGDRPSRVSVPPSGESYLSMGLPQHDSVDKGVHLFATDLREKIQASILRSAPYRAMIHRILKEEGLPSGLAWLPVIESAFIPTLTSRAGAHGLWQFMEETGREYGLRVDWWIDERADPVRSTRAAARYLKDLHRMFGDWPLALAAYNGGPGRVRRALASHDAVTFWELSEKQALPRETRGYVPTFYATLVLVSDPESHGFRVPPPSPPDVRVVELEGPLSLRWLAGVSGGDEELLRSLNPALKRVTIPPGRHPVYLPAAAVAEVLARAETLRFEDPFVQVAIYNPRSGDSIASLSRRLSLSQSDILRMNGFSPNRKLRNGDTIYLPLSQAELSNRLHPSATQRVHVVSRGDTLFSIARKHGTTIETLLDLNRLSRDHILQPGDELLVHLEGGVSAGGGM